MWEKWWHDKRERAIGLMFRSERNVYVTNMKELLAWRLDLREVVRFDVQMWEKCWHLMFRCKRCTDKMFTTRELLTGVGELPEAEWLAVGDGVAGTVEQMALWGWSDLSAKCLQLFRWHQLYQVSGTGFLAPFYYHLMHTCVHVCLCVCVCVCWGRRSPACITGLQWMWEMY